jgi:ribosomal 30S subunit maturation factor RimM
MPELLLPALKTVIREVDIEKKRIIVELPQGLKEIYELPAKK